MQNPYIPYPVVVDKIITEVDTKDIKTFRFKFINPEDEAKYAYIPGQFGELSIYGKGESPIGIASSPTQKGYVEFTVQKAGVVTSALHEMEEGESLGELDETEVFIRCLDTYEIPPEERSDLVDLFREILISVQEADQFAD